MKKEEKAGLSEAIKRHYRTEPLNIHLPTTVADRVFGKKTSPEGNGWLYFPAALCSLAIVAICISALAQCSFSPVLIGVGLSVAAFLGLSYKEFLIWSDGEDFQEIQ